MENHDMGHMDKMGSTAHYKNLLLMTLLSFISMYIFMYSMVDSFEHVYWSFNQFYMAAVMTAPMVFIEILVMKGMYADKKKNMIIGALALIGLIVFFIFIRQQTGINDKQFLRSMIPHHAGALLMCEQSKAENQEIKDLCKQIISGQTAEIKQMKKLLNEIEK